jgi:hypothetical protein
MNKRLIIILLCDACLFATGILGIFVPNALLSNWYSLLTVLMFAFSFVLPLMCNSLQVGGNKNSSDLDLMLMDDFSSGNDLVEKGKSVSWLVMAIFLTLGYSIPFLLWRKSLMKLTNMAFAMGGGTLILISIGVFIKFVLLSSSS